MESKTEDSFLSAAENGLSCEPNQDLCRKGGNSDQEAKSFGPRARNERREEEEDSR